MKCLKSTRVVLAAVLLAAGLLAGCSGLRPYPDNFKKNLFIHTETDSGSAFSSIRAAMDVYGVKAGCEAEYRGTVKLTGANTEVGIPTGQTSYLVFVFSGSSFLGGKSSMSHGALLKARAGRTYEARVSYDDDIYNVEIVEKGGRKGKGREVKIRELNECGSI